MRQVSVGRRGFLGTGAGWISARLIGTTLAPGVFISDSVAALSGATQSVAIKTHEWFGDIDERLDFPQSWDVHVQKMAGHDAPLLSTEEIRRRIQSPIGARPLREIAAGKKRVVITFDDLTRPTPTYAIAPIVVEELKAAGITDDNILFMGSYGTHRNLEQHEVALKIGTELTRRYVWVNHNTFENVKDVGETSYKNRIKVNLTFMSADLKVTISGVKTHSSAGYGGGAKAILPGVSWIDTVQYNHSTIGAGNKTAGPLKVFKNEERLDMVEAARLAGVDFSVQVVYNHKRQVSAVFAGDIVEAHHAACRMANRHYRTPTFQNADVVVANGYPQNSEAQVEGLGWVNASVRPGGTGVLIVQYPPGMLAWHGLTQRSAGKRSSFDAMRRPQGRADHAQLIVYSQYLQKQMMDKFPQDTLFAWSWDEVTKLLLARHKADARVAVYPYSTIQHPETDLDE